ncbi:MAG TPA: CpsD/CapB family tyrosine-protein kinase [Candidatus Limnocylindria bacterium]|jgi:capsular exopolysaccharide synthesis family protein|nr:CpsD/CapB family tyrosine-protein kinase [Candidatus Limnocylindria bacterium]
MSKFFNETQKANQWAQQKLANQDMDVKELLESLKRGPGSDTQLADKGLSQCRQVHVGNGNAARLVLHQGEASRAALEAYRGLRTRLMRAQAKTGLKSIAITSSLPGEGKTLTTMNLGLCYAQLPQQRVLVIDADLRMCGLTSMLDHPSTPGLAEVLAGDVSPDEAIVSTNQKNLFVLPAGTVLSSPPELFIGSRWQEFMGRCSELFKLILIDTPPILPLADFELISAACDGVVMVVRAHHGQRETLQKTAGALDPKKLLGVVFNATDVSGKDYDGYGYGSGKS